MRKLSCFVMAMALLFSAGALTGCGKSIGEDIDPNRTQVYVMNYDGGFGQAWIQEAKRLYELKHPERQIVLSTGGDDKMANSILMSTMRGSGVDVYFANSIYYNDFVSQRLLLDVTDVVTTPLKDMGYEENESIIDKLDPQLKGFYNKGTAEAPKYYSLPFYETYYHIIYNIDLFEAEKLYFSADSPDLADDADPVEIMDDAVFTGETNKGTGPDGIAGTDDDGLPRTFIEFKVLLEKMVSKRIDPFDWSGNPSYYSSSMLNQVWADFEGKENFSLNFSLNGVHTFKDGTTMTVDETDAYELQKQQGKKYGVDFAHHIMSKSEFRHAQAGGNTNTYTGVQSEFVLNGYTNSNKKIGMIFDGTWWENEADEQGSFQHREAVDANLSRSKSRYGIFAVPKAKLEYLGPATTYVSSLSQVFINASTPPERLEAAKDFYAFCHTDPILRLFTATAGGPRAFDYDMSTEQLSTMSHFENTVWKRHKAAFGNTETGFVYNAPTAQINVRNAKHFNEAWMWTSIPGGTQAEVANPFETFKNYGNITPEQYFSGLYTYEQGKWGTLSRV